MKEHLICFWKNIKNIEFSDISILVIICVYLFFCFCIIFKTKSKNKFIRYSGMSIFYIFTVFVGYLVLFRTGGEVVTQYLDRLNIIATITLTIVALKMSIGQNRIANFDFSEKIGFPNLKYDYELNKTVVTDLNKYKIYKQSISMPTQEDTEIYDFVFVLDKPLNPQIFYDLKTVRIYNSRVYPQEIKSDKKTPCDTYTKVSFESNSLNKSTIRIIIDDTEKKHLPVLKNPDKFSNESCNELTVVFDFFITDLVNNAFANKRLFLIVRFTKCNQQHISYVISSVQTFVYK